MPKISIVKISRVSWREWVGLGAGLLAFASLFWVWTSLDAGSREIEDALSDLPVGDVFRNGWTSGVFSWFPAIVVVLAGVFVVLFGQNSKLRKSGLPQLWLVATVVALGITVLGWFMVGWGYGAEQRELFKQAGIAVYSGFGRYVGSFAVALSVVAAVIDVLAARAEMHSVKRGKRPAQRS